MLTTRRNGVVRWRKSLAVAGVAMLALTGCVSQSDRDGGSNGGPAGTIDGVSSGLINVAQDAGTPVDGGTLTFGSFAPVASLDPVVTRPDGAAGGTEMAAVYDLLARYDYDSKKFVPQLAEAITPSAGDTVWTIKLRPGVTFSDGTPLDAAAVVGSIDRYNAKRGGNAQLYTDRVASTVATAPDTVTVTLKAPWPLFPSLLASGHGLIVAPAAYAGAKFTPIGAGPFTVEQLQAQQKLTLKARPDYWNGKPHLNGLDFVALANDDARVSTLNSGGADAVYLYHPEQANAEAKTAPGFLRTDAIGVATQINAAPGHPGADPRVRRAITLALNPETYDQRVNAGTGLPGTTIFPDWSTWHSDAAGPTPDAAKAKQLLDEAKADGYDGHLVHVAVNAPDGQQGAVTTQAMLNAVGFDVRIEFVNDATDLVRRLYAAHDFDTSNSSYSISDAAPGIRLFSALNSKSTSNILGYHSPQMDALLDDVVSAPDAAAKKTALAQVQQLVDTDAPLATLGATRAFIAWTPKVHGVVPSDSGIMLFGGAWKK